MAMGAEALKEHRINAGLTQAGAAREYGVGQSTWAMYESGKRPVPPNLEAAILGGPAVQVVNRPEALIAKAKEVEAAPKAVAAQAAASIAGVAESALPLRAKVQAFIEAGAPRSHAEYLMRQGARRPTAQEVARQPGAYDGPNVWLIRHDPPIKHDSGAVVTVTVIRFPANGMGESSVHLLGSTKGVDVRAQAPDAIAPGLLRRAGCEAGGGANPRQPVKAKGRR